MLGGDLTTAGNNAANRIAKWNTTNSTWSLLGTSTNNGVGGNVYALTVIDNILYVGGSFTTAGGSTANNIAKWTGSEWKSLI